MTFIRGQRIIWCNVNKRNTTYQKESSLLALSKMLFPFELFSITWQDTSSDHRCNSGLQFGMLWRLGNSQSNWVLFGINYWHFYSFNHICKCFINRDELMERERVAGEIFRKKEQKVVIPWTKTGNLWLPTGLDAKWWSQVEPLKAIHNYNLLSLSPKLLSFASFLRHSYHP